MRLNNEIKKLSEAEENHRNAERKKNDLAGTLVEIEWHNEG